MISYDDIKSGKAAVPVTKAEAISTGEYRSIELQAIRIDQSAQPRESLNTERTAEYAEAMKAGDKFPSLVVFFDGETYWLADGFHRHYAAQQAGIKALSCRVLPGGLRDAILWSVGANAKHGLARSDEDKKRAVMRLLDDAEWSTWTDRDIAKRCHVSHPFVAKVRKAHAGDTGNASSMERTYVHPKTGKPTTMKTAGINASRTQFQAKASEDNGSITGGAGAVTGEASRLASGRTDAGEASSVDLPTDFDDIDTRTDVEREADAMVLAWDKGRPESREKFLGYLRFIGFTITEGNPAPGMGGINVDRSAECASSAVEVGAPVSPEGAQASLANGPCEAVSERTAPVERRTPGRSKDQAAVESEGVTAGETALNPPSTAPTVEPEATPSPPPASGNPFPDPLTPVVATADQAHQASQLPAQNDDVPHVVGQGGLVPVEHCGHAEQEDASATQARNEPGSVSGATVTNPKPFVLRPHCLNPDLCAGSGANHCHACKKAMAESEAA